MTLQLAALYVLSSSTIAFAQDSSNANKLVARDEDGEDASQSIVLAHGVLMAALFIIFFPLGAIILRISKSPHAAWIHGIWQTLSYVAALAGLGLGAYLATMEEKWTAMQGHAILGVIVIGLLFVQPIGGLIHHRMYSKHGRSTAIGRAHKWSGRILLVLGVINGGLGLWLADEDNDFIIPYSIIAGVFYAVWAGCVWRTTAAAHNTEGRVQKERPSQSSY